MLFVNGNLDVETPPNIERDHLEYEAPSVKEADVLHAMIQSGAQPPDGGYGWVIVACTFLLSGRQSDRSFGPGIIPSFMNTAVTWGSEETCSTSISCH